MQEDNGPFFLEIADTNGPHDASAGNGGSGAGSGDDEAEPDSFSQVDLAAGQTEISAQFPDFPGVQKALQVDVHAGG